MTKVMVTGAKGFIGKHLVFALQSLKDMEIVQLSRDDSNEILNQALMDVDVIFHLAGVNRPKQEAEFWEVNTIFTENMVQMLKISGRAVPIIFSSSNQASMNNAYGVSKRASEKIIEKYAQSQKTNCSIYRLDNVFGARCRPNYNSVVATFCHNLTRDLSIEIREPNRMLELIWVGDVVEQFLQHLQPSEDSPTCQYLSITPSYSLELQVLAKMLQSFVEIRKTGQIPDLSDRLTKLLHSTFISYYPLEHLSYSVNRREDARGWLFELIRSSQGGQIFVSSTKPGIERGNHFHEVKIEKFCVVQGKAVIKLRDKDGGEVKSYKIDSGASEIIDIPPHYTHKITNVGNEDLITIFWASEPFNTKRPDTFFEAVENDR